MSKTNDTINEVRALGIDAYLARQQDKSLLRMLTCGSVDDGKSTLIAAFCMTATKFMKINLQPFTKTTKKLVMQVKSLT